MNHDAEEMRHLNLRLCALRCHCWLVQQSLLNFASHSSLHWAAFAIVAAWATVATAADATAGNAAALKTRTSAAANPPQGSDWPGFLGPTGDSKSAEVGLTVPWPAQGPPLVWQLELGDGYGPPAVASGRLFQFDRRAGNARLRVVNSRTGKLLWTFEYASAYEDMYGYDNGPRCSPVVDDGRVYIFGAEGMLQCLTAATGNPIWKVDTAKQFGVVQNFFGVGSTPVVTGNLVIAQIGGSPPESQQVPPGQLHQVVGNGSGIVAFDKRTGAVRYKLTDELASYAGPKLATIGGRAWCFVFARGGLVAFDPTSGKLDFHYPWRARSLESVNASNPVVAGNQVLISETYGPGSSLLEVRPGGYKVVWSDAARRREKAMQTHWNTPIYHAGFLYGSSGRHQGDAVLRCIRLATGEIMWSQPDLARSSLLYVDGHFVCLSEDGTLRLIKVNPRRYELVSEVVLHARGSASVGATAQTEDSLLLKPPAWAAPVLVHGLLYVRGRDRLVCLRAMSK